MQLNLKDKLRQKELTIGSWLTFSDPAIAEIMAKSGFDWLVIDMEHSALSFNQAQELIRIIDLCNVAPLVRVMENNPNLIKRFMDIGAHGVIVPMVNSKSDAEKAVNAVKYPPLGTRGVGLSRAQKYSLDFNAYFEWNQKHSVVIVQIESIQAVSNIHEIANVSGVDGFIIGPYDLSGSLGVPGDLSSKKMASALNKVMKETMDLNISRGYHVVSPEINLVKEKIDEGYNFIGFSTDFIFLGESIKNKIKNLLY